MSTRRRRKGDGSVYEDAERGRWIGAITVNGKRYRVARKTKTETRAALKALADEARAGTLGIEPEPDPSSPDPSSLTVAEVLDDFLDRDLAGRDRAPSTVTVHRWAAAHIRDQLGDTLAVDLRVRHIDDMLDHLADVDELSRASLSKVRGTLSQALRFAVRRGDLERNVAADATIPPNAPRTQSRRSLTPDQARTMLAALRDEPNGAMFALSLRIGLRPGEAAGLYWHDLRDGALNITRAVRLTKGRAEVVDDLKVETARRTIVLPDRIVDWLGDHRRRQLEERMSAPRWADERLMFASPTGNVLSPPNVRRQLVDICERIDADRAKRDPEGDPFPTIKPNELRHSCASLLSDIGVPNEEIADLLGHTTTRMVDQTYRHRLRPVVDVAARADWTSTANA